MSELKKKDLHIQSVTYDFDGLKQEMVFVLPEKSPAPGIIFIHGHRGNSYAALIVGKAYQEMGYAVCLPTMMGYGNSQGKQDYCGPQTIAAVKKGIEIYLQQDFVDKDKVGIHGVSRGAVTASLLTADPELSLKAAVFEAGAYDLEYLYKNQTIPESTRKNIERETGGSSSEELHKRSSIYSADKIRCPVMLLHGEKDDTFPVEQATMMDKKLTESKVPHILALMPEKEHFLGKQGRETHAFPFLNGYLK